MTETRDQAEQSLVDADPRTCRHCHSTRMNIDGILVCDTLDCPANCDHENVECLNPVRSPMADARYRCHDCGASLVDDEPGCGYEVVA